LSVVTRNGTQLVTILRVVRNERRASGRGRTLEGRTACEERFVGDEEARGNETARC
jgi:hypothetical protein